MEILTAEECAERLGIKPVTMRAWLNAGRVPGAFKKGGVWLIPSSSLAVINRPDEKFDPRRKKIE